MMWNIHFDIAGEIVQVDNSPEAFRIEPHDCITVEIDDPSGISVRTHRVSNGVLIEKTDREKAAANAPTLRQLQEAVFSELCRTDSFVVPDRPMTDATREAWSTYRQMLRDLSKLATPADMINAWTTPPDGVDPITNLKGRI